MKDIDKFAKLIVKKGLNLQKKQTLVMTSPIECVEVARAIQLEAYKAGAREVVIRWHDEKATRVDFDMAADETFDEFPEWSKLLSDSYADAGAAFLYIAASDPEIMKGVDPKRISRKNKAKNKALEYFRSRQMSNKNVWCVASVPSEAWAKKVFPKKSGAAAVSALWTAICKTMRLDTPDPVKAWDEHQKALNVRLKFLQKHAFKSLHYKNSAGTDFTVELPHGHVWEGGGAKSPAGKVFFPNMPTEEVFTMPHKNGANGKIVSTMPLNYNGNLIEDFWFVFKNGLVTEYGAKKGKDVLKELLNTDDGAKRLGEVALVPYESPISKMGILFYNTLFDENASCHFALGKAYPTCLADSEKMTAKQLSDAGANDSLTHVDFMIGSKDLEITGTRPDGKVVPVFVKGNFAL